MKCRFESLFFIFVTFGTAHKKHVPSNEVRVSIVIFEFYKSKVDITFVINAIKIKRAIANYILSTRIEKKNVKISN